MKNKYLTTSLILILLFSPYVFSEANYETSLNRKTERKIEHKLKHMSLREKVGQLFVIRPESLDESLSSRNLNIANCKGITELSPSLCNFYNRYPAGGFVLFQKNIINPKQINNFNNNLHKLNKNIKNFIYIDEEGGATSRIANNNNFNVPVYKSMSEIGKSLNSNNAFQAGKEIGTYLKRYGFDVDFAPIADVNTNPNNPVIGIRAFSSDPKIAAEMDIAFLNGIHEKKIKGCLKHFPGHGDTNNDSHAGYVETKKTWDELKNCELITFQAGIDNNVQMIMAAHISTPNITGDKLPATLSYYLLTEKLRNEMKYDGIIITDAMEMGAIHNDYSSDEAAVMAISAGADIILMPYDYKKAFEGVLQAVKNGSISEQRINQSVKRILKLKIQ